LRVSIADSDNMVAGVTVSQTNIRVAEGGTARYTVVLEASPERSVRVTVTSQMPEIAQVNEAGEAPDSSASLVFQPMTFTSANWGIPQAITVTGVAEGETEIRHAIAGGDGVGYTAALEIADVRVSVTDDEEPVVDADAMTQAEIAEMQAAQEVWLPQFGVVAVEHMLNGLEYRFTVTDRPGLSGNLNGLPDWPTGVRSLSASDGAMSGAGIDGFGNGGSGDSLGAGSVDRLFNLSRSLSLSLPGLLHGSRFLYSDQNRLSVWGQVSHSGYEDTIEGVSVDGEITTSMLGVDSDSGRTLLGLALSYSDGDGDWDGALGDGRLSSSLLSLLPYIRHDVSERLQVWGAASYGEGELEQTATNRSGVTSDIQHDLKQFSASAGVRGKLLEWPLEEGGLTLTLISDATLSRIETEEESGMEGLTADTQRFRMGLEWSWQLPQAEGGRLIPELEMGVRYDGGDTNDGFGIELGGGISWELPASGLTLDVRGRYLLEHEVRDRREWGISGSLRYDLQPGSSYGPSLSLRQEYGNVSTASGLSQMLSSSLSDSLKQQDASEAGEVSSSWNLEGEWGFALEDGATGIPYAGLSSSGAERDLTLGWRLLSAPGEWNTELDIKAIRREGDQGEVNHGIGAEFKLNW